MSRFVSYPWAPEIQGMEIENEVAQTESVGIAAFAVLFRSAFESD
jgi:hypothetical protein